MVHLVYYLFSILLLPCVMFAKSDIFTSTFQLKSLIEVEKKLIDTITNYIENEYQRLEKIDSNLEEYRQQYQSMSEDAETFLNNPLNAYSLIKKLSANWHDLHRVLRPSDVTIDTSKLPDSSDLLGAVQGLSKLRKTYNLNVSTFVDGNVNENNYKVNLSSSDIFEIGYQFFDAEAYAEALLWFKEAERKYQSENQDDNFLDLNDLRVYLARTHFALRNQVEYKRYLSKMPDSDFDNFDLYYALTYQKLCKGDELLPATYLSELKCRYISNGNSFLLLAPFKVEEKFRNPEILVFHEVISDREISIIKQQATKKFHRSLIDTDKIGHDRISKTAWLYESDHPLMTTLNRRVSDMTSMTMKQSEAYQTVNYGIGGWYNMHYDATINDEIRMKRKKEFSDRIATVLFYLNDVKEGGATAFPVLQTAVKPIKSTAVLWYNLHSDGNPDIRTLHGGCPVLLGNKWVCNKWINEHHQTFLKPCTLNPGS